jgi:uncharacterized membrane protein SpoIIM required for sporulation
MFKEILSVFLTRMKESKFIKKNQDKWIRFEKMLSKKDNNPDELSSLFIEINEDSSYASTFYKNRIITKYLNKLSVKLFSKLYGKVKNKKGFWFFWKEELPYVAYKCRKQLYLCMGLLILTIALGVVSSYVNPAFCEQILGDDYIKMTEENIASNDPMAVYKSAKGGDMFLSISLNNVRVSLLTFVSGIIGGIGSLVVLAHNGVMVGAFQYFFIERGLFVESFLTIWMHGAIEVSLIAIEATAGFVLGLGLILPGNLPRMTSFKISAKRGVKLLLGSLPLIVLAAIIESFVTRYTDLPNAIRLLFILLSFGLVAFLFFIYPLIVAKRGFLPEVIDTDQVLPSSYKKLDQNSYRIKGVNQVFSESVLRLKQSVKASSLQLCFLGVIAAIAMTYLTTTIENPQNYLNYYPQVQSVFFGPLLETLNYGSYPSMFAVNLIVLTFAVLFGVKKKGKPFISIFSLLSTIVLVTFVTLLMQVTPWFILLIFLLLPFIFTFLSLQHIAQYDLYRSISESFKYVGKSYFNFLGSQMLFFLMLLLVFVLLNSWLFELYTEFVQPFLFTSSTSAEIFTSLCMYSLYFFALILYVMASVFACSLQFQQSTEIVDAHSLKEKIKAL